jgi:hypothetical protein
MGTAGGNDPQVHPLFADGMGQFPSVAYPAKQMVFHSLQTGEAKFSQAVLQEEQLR